LKLLLLLLMGCLLVVTAGLFALMFRRDEPILGLAGLTAAIGAAFVALPYSALEDF
jgi:ABC-type transport system involved in cytochrome c biogenesis permease component